MDIEGIEKSLYASSKILLCVRSGIYTAPILL